MNKISTIEKTRLRQKKVIREVLIELRGVSHRMRKLHKELNRGLQNEKQLQKT